MGTERNSKQTTPAKAAAKRFRCRYAEDARRLKSEKLHAP